MANKRILSVTWDKKYSGVYYVHVNGTDYEVEINDNLSINPDCKDKSLRSLIVYVVNYFIDKEEVKSKL
jgi:hypothetical protein